MSPLIAQSPQLTPPLPFLRWHLKSTATPAAPPTCLPYSFLELILFEVKQSAQNINIELNELSHSKCPCNHDSGEERKRDQHLTSPPCSHYLFLSPQWRSITVLTLNITVLCCWFLAFLEIAEFCICSSVTLAWYKWWDSSMLWLLFISTAVKYSVVWIYHIPLLIHT